MTQYIVKDARGTDVQSLDQITSYAKVAREMLSIGATLPLTVWKHNTLTATQSYDGKRTQQLSSAVVAARKVSP